MASHVEPMSRNFKGDSAMNAHNGRVKGAADCVICTRESAAAESPEILQIIEGLSYHPEIPTVRILLLFIVKNRGASVARFRIVHRGGVTATLEPFSFQPTEERRQLINKLYANRITASGDDSAAAHFFQRVNCLWIDHEPINVSLNGPGECFRTQKEPITLVPDSPQCDEPPAFTSYMIPPAELEGIAPGECTAFIVTLELTRESYARLVDHTFSVDSYARLMRDIETCDITKAGKETRDFYDTHIRSRDMVIAPMTYDIVIFQDLGERVDVRSGSINITPVRSEDRALADRVLWFFGHPDEFYLVLSYSSRMPAKKMQVLQAVV